MSRVEVVRTFEAGRARALAVGGVVVVVAGRDADHVGALVASITATGGRAAAFVGDLELAADRAALDEMVAELFPDREPDAPEPA